MGDINKLHVECLRSGTINTFTSLPVLVTKMINVNILDSYRLVFMRLLHGAKCLKNKGNHMLTLH